MSLYQTQHKSRYGRRGLTLVELLVVIGIIVVLVAVAIPLMKINQDSRPIREASRAINAYVAAAQSRAAEKGRPVGVWIDRAENNSGSSFRLFMADVAPPYVGDTAEARARIAPHPTRPGYFVVRFYRVPNTGAGPPRQLSTALTRLVSEGDVIRFGFKGSYYEIQDDLPPPPQQPPPYNPVLVQDPGNPPIYQPDPPGQPSLPQITIKLGANVRPVPVGYWDPAPPANIHDTSVEIKGSSVAYQILRAPRKSRFSSIELPNSAAIDLRVSGAGASLGPVLFEPSSPTDTSPVVIMFSPSGRVDHLRVQGQILVPQETIHLMVGNNELVNSSDDAASIGGVENLEAEKAQTNLWVSIGLQTGSVTTSEMNAMNATTPLPAGYNRAQFIQHVLNARQIANEKHQMGGG